MIQKGNLQRQATNLQHQLSFLTTSNHGPWRLDCCWCTYLKYWHTESSNLFLYCFPFLLTHRFMKRLCRFAILSQLPSHVCRNINDSAWICYYQHTLKNTHSLWWMVDWENSHFYSKSFFDGRRNSSHFTTSIFFPTTVWLVILRRVCAQELHWCEIEHEKSLVLLSAVK